MVIVVWATQQKLSSKKKVYSTNVIRWKCSSFQELCNVAFRPKNVHTFYTNFIPGLFYNWKADRKTNNVVEIFQSFYSFFLFRRLFDLLLGSFIGKGKTQVAQWTNELLKNNVFNLFFFVGIVIKLIVESSRLRLWKCLMPL